ncbi:MAG: hypothetical protein QF773_07595 [Lentisphaeria bacterium]|nr:hypothetical protein [Lentisphaeria bacterium]
MYKVQFSIVGQDSPINSLSKAFPSLEIVSLGGFDLDETSAEQFAAIRPDDADELKAVLEYLATAPGFEGFELLEQTDDQAFLRWQAACAPENFNSRVVQENQCFKIGMEELQNGEEKWTVGCTTEEQAQRLLDELGELGELTSSEISEDSWQLVLGN